MLRPTRINYYFKSSERTLMSGVNPDKSTPTEYINCLFHANVNRDDVHPDSTFINCEYMGRREL